MPNEKEIIALMKDSFPTHPHPDFVEKTELLLKKKAVRYQQKKKLTHIAMSVSICMITAIVLTLVFLPEQLKHSKPNKAYTAISSTGKNPLVYIYHTHSSEAYLSKASQANNNPENQGNKSVSLVGEQLSKALKVQKIDSLHDQSDIVAQLEEQQLAFPQAYTLSRKTFMKSIQSHQSIKLALDIHRDSGQRKSTTIKIAGKNYGKIQFVVSKSTIYYEQNKALAELLHNELEKMYPGISNGILFLSIEDKNRNGIYNQDIMPQTLLVNIGGNNNTIKEANRSITALAKVIVANRQVILQ